MKRVMIAVLAAGVLLGVSQGVEAQSKQRGGFLGLVAGCCFGVRTSGEYNAGKEIHWREWIRLVIPIVPMVWDGMEGAQGKTTADYAQQYGSMYY